MQNDDLDKLYLRAAIRLAEKGLYTVTRNNPRVGCLIVKGGRVIGRGFHREDGGAHAEVDALRQVEGDASGATAYVSLEPCSVHGRTPPCTEALLNADIARVVVAELDPNPQVNGSGLARLRKAGIKACLVKMPETQSLNPGFRKRMELGMPYVRIKSGVSLDGRIAMKSGESQWITSSEARGDVQYLRARSSAIITGIGTVLADNPRLTVRKTELMDSEPIRLLLDTVGRLRKDARLLEQGGPLVVVSHENSEVPGSVEKWSHDGTSADLNWVLKKLAEIGANEVLVEAGPTLTGSFLRQGLWDELVFYIAPKLLGSTAKPVALVTFERLVSAVGGRIESITPLGPDVRVVVKNDAAI